MSIISMQPTAVLTEPPGIHDMQHAMVRPAETAHAASSGSMTPRSHAHREPTTTQESTSSHDSSSPLFQLSSSDVSQYNRPEATNPDFSPISSQEHGSSASYTSGAQDEAQGTKFPELHDTTPPPPDAKSESPDKDHFARDLMTGQKRTASGQMKRSSITNIEDLKKEQATTRHSRTSSLLSNSSTGSVMEVRSKVWDGGLGPSICCILREPVALTRVHFMSRTQGY